MKYLVVYSHPNPKSFCHAILETVKEALTAKKHEVIIRDLYALKFNPVLTPSDFEALATGKVLPDVKAEQDHIQWADILIYIYPIWWTGLPAMVKGYIDRVFSHGFAFKIGVSGAEGLLKGKKAVILNTQGTPQGYYESSSMSSAIRKTSDAGIFEFCGIEVAEHKFFAGVPSVNDTVRKQYLDEIRVAISKIS